MTSSLKVTPKHHYRAMHYCQHEHAHAYSQYGVLACFWLLELLGDPFSKTITVNLYSWSAVVKLICKRLFRL